MRCTELSIFLPGFILNVGKEVPKKNDMHIWRIWGEKFHHQKPILEQLLYFDCNGKIEGNLPYFVSGCFCPQDSSTVGNHSPVCLKIIKIYIFLEITEQVSNYLVIFTRTGQKLTCSQVDGFSNFDWSFSRWRQFTTCSRILQFLLLMLIRGIVI